MVVPYVARDADQVLVEMLEDHAAVLVVGPRGAGKTTSCEQQARTIIRLGDKAVADAFRAGPGAILSERDEPILVDEWQEVPVSLQAIKIAVDTNPSRGRFLVTGSVRGDIDAPTWPGTGRLVRLPMYGLTEREIEGRVGSQSWLNTVLSGEPVPHHRSETDVRGYVQRALRSGFPEPALMTTDRGRARWLSSYVDQLVTRDAQSISPGRDPQRLRSYLTALALNSAGIVDDITLWTGAGIAKDTARAYDTLLQNLLVTDRLPAWTSTRLKRLTLAPKRYLVDAGLFTGVLGLTESDVLVDGDMLGRLIETFVVAQCRAEIALMSPAPRMHHLRMAEGQHEIDLVIEVGPRRLVAFEIKATASPDPGDARHLRWFRRKLGDDRVTTILLHTGQESLTFDDGTHAVPISALWR
jgi:predicted AAA+ superfamily ATPase